MKAIGIGECAGVVIDLVSTLLFESEEKLENAQNAFKESRWADAIYHAYTAFVNTAKAQLTVDGHKTNAHASIIKGFDEHYVNTGKISLDGPFEKLVYQKNHEASSKQFASQ